MSPDWTTITTPNAVFAASFLTSVAEVGPNDIWAGGTYQGDSSSTQYNPFFEHWDGTSWTLTAAPLPSSGAEGQISGMSVNSANDIWAVGLYEIGANAYELIYHWNGLQWDIVAGPQPSTTDNELFGVTVVSTNNVWAAGTYTMAGLKKTLIEHWDGSTWSQVGSPNEGTGDNSLQSISVVPGSSGNDIWAAGNYYPTPGSPEQTLTLRYNGVLWSYVDSANQGMGDNQLKGITAISAGDVWAVGSYRIATIQHTLAEHWNGSVWSISPTMNPGSQGNTFVSVFATAGNAGNNVWAVGESVNGITTIDTLVEHTRACKQHVLPVHLPPGKPHNHVGVCLRAPSGGRVRATGQPALLCAQQQRHERADLKDRVGHFLP